MENIEVKRIAHNSPEYAAEVALRYSILRQQLGLRFSEEQLSLEANSYHIGCYLDEKLLGCLVLKPVDEKRMQMRQVAVDNMFQGKGVGRGLVAYSEIFARNLDYNEMFLHARETAVPFYERLQYRKFGDSFTEISVPHWLMSKALL